MASANLDDFTVEVVTKPQPGVISGEVPPKLAAYLTEKVPEVMNGNADRELLLNAQDEKSAKLLASYARAWGALQDPKLRITKVANRHDMPANVARLSVQLESDVPAENRPGRRAKPFGLPH